MRFCSIFNQLLQLFSRADFQRAVKESEAERHARVWVPEILAAGFRKFWPVDLMPQVRSGRQARGAWCASTGHPA